MTEAAEFARTGDGRPVYRRRHPKRDGREVLLYGYARPDSAPVSEGLDAAAGAAELRWHPLRQEWNVYAAARQNRTYKPPSSANPLSPTLPGGSDTEIPFAAFELAVFANRFPSFTRHAALAPDGPPLIKRAPAAGHCDVVVFSPEPEGSLATLGEDRRRLLVHAWIDRYQALFEQGFDYVLPFENRGEEVGVTLHHPHGQ
ncbi:MAG: hypothetical protein MI723_15670, partial [Caulobacterales bacterium]|nr:hypothetical protein [Caulobacterales bacterium]